MKLVPVIVFALSFVVMALPVKAAQTSADSVEVEDPFVRAAPAGMRVSAMFMKIRNLSKGHQHLVQVTGDVAESIELHEHVHTGGMMRMRQIEEILIAGDGVTELEPGGLHVMLIGLKGALEVGQEIEFTLVFSDKSTKKITVPVKSISAM